MMCAFISEFALPNEAVAETILQVGWMGEQTIDGRSASGE
jgi:hypothetical protein